MEKQVSMSKFTPTPPTSARPSSNRRSGRRIKSGADQKPSDVTSIETAVRQSSFSNYEVLPPINDAFDLTIENHGVSKDEPVDKNVQTQVAKKKYRSALQKEALENQKGGVYKARGNQKQMNDLETLKNPESGERTGERTGEKTGERAGERTGERGADMKDQPIEKNGAVKEQRKLYRKGDIFRNRKEASLNKEAEHEGAKPADKLNLERLFSIPAEPDNTMQNKLHIAFRIPDGERLQRCFLPTDRVGDIFAFLKSKLDAENGDCSSPRLELSTNDFPTRKLDNLNTTLTEAGLADKIVLNVIILDDPD